MHDTQYTYRQPCIKAACDCECMPWYFVVDKVAGCVMVCCICTNELLGLALLITRRRVLDIPCCLNSKTDFVYVLIRQPFSGLLYHNIIITIIQAIGEGL